MALEGNDDELMDSSEQTLPPPEDEVVVQL